MRSSTIVALLLVAFASTEASSSSEVKCKANGFFRHPDDCTRFYRCVDLTGAGYFQKYTFSCPAGTVFDENVSVCNHPWAAPPCDNKSEESLEVIDDNDTNGEETVAETTTKPSVIVQPTFPFECTDKGIFPHNNECGKFWLCKLSAGNPELYKCPSGYLFNDENRRCVPAEQVECSKVPNLLRTALENQMVTVLQVSELDSFFARWGN